jgi:hypothetical protein
VTLLLFVEICSISKEMTKEKLKDMLRVQKNGIIENIQLKFKKQEKL